MTKVLAENIVKLFGNVAAINDVTVEFKDGDLTVLVGPSGCGKTTLLRMVAGLEDPTSGNIYIGDRRVNDVPPWHRDTAMVFQNYALYPHMTVFDNIAYPLRSRGEPKRDIKPRVEHTAAMLGLGELLRRKPRELSGGQMQRVAVGRAIVRRPGVFLMDEPLSNLDAKLRVEMRAELKRLQEDLGVTTIYVTHDQAEAMTMADTLIVMRNGVILQSGVPQVLYDTPHCIFVAGFIGSPPDELPRLHLRQQRQLSFGRLLYVSGSPAPARCTGDRTAAPGGARHPPRGHHCERGSRPRRHPCARLHVRAAGP